MKFTHTHAPADHSRALAHIAELSKNARATWFGLLGLLVFVGVTLLAHKDADFFAFGAETQLPLVGIKVPVKAFFYTAPLLVAALYIYLHLYLMNLWDALADAPARIEGKPLADQVFPWLISHAALWYRNRMREDRSTAPRALGWVVVAVSVALGWAFGLVILGGLWFRSLPAHDEWLTLWIAACLWAAAAVGYTGFRAAPARMQGKPRAEVVRARTGLRTLGGVLAALLAFISWETTEGTGVIKYRFTDWDGSVESRLPLYRANLVAAELTRRPTGWMPWHLWREDFEERFRRREGISPGPDLTAEQKLAFEQGVKERYTEYTAQLDAPDLLLADLRDAKMLGAFLPGADLRAAEMQGADLAEAEMQGADLTLAKIQVAVLRSANMQRADLIGVQMQGAVLYGVQMVGADLSWVQMQDADCDGAILRGALLQSANLTCKNLTQDKLEQAVGDSETVLPDGLTVASCLETLPEDVEAALAHHPEVGDFFRKSRADIRDALLCDRDADGNLTEQSVRVGRSASPEQ